MNKLRIILAATLITISSADFLFAKSYREIESEEKIAMIYGVSMVLAGIAIGGGIYLSKRSGKKKNNENS